MLIYIELKTLDSSCLVCVESAIYLIFYLGRFPPLVHRLFDGRNSSVLDSNRFSLRPPATSKACLKHRRKRSWGYFHLLSTDKQQARPEERDIEDIFTFSPPTSNKQGQKKEKLRIFSPALHRWQSLCSCAEISEWPGREGNPGICRQSRTWDRKKKTCRLSHCQQW